MSAPHTPALPGARRAGPARMAVTLVVATVGFGLNLRAWTLLDNIIPFSPGYMMVAWGKKKAA